MQQPQLARGSGGGRCGVVIGSPWSPRRSHPSRPRSSAAVSSQCSSITWRARSRLPGQDRARRARACWRSEWAMLASSTGIAQQHLVQGRLDRGDRLDHARGAGQRGDGEVEAGVGLPVLGRAAGAGDRRVRPRRAGPGAASSSSARGGQAGRARARRSGGSRGRRASPGAGPSVTPGGGARRTACAACSVTTVPPPRPRRGLDQSGLAQRGHRLAQGRPGDVAAARRARARAAACVPRG